MSKVFDPTIGALNTSLNLRLMNQNVISSNIANADTPGYKAKRVEFERAFRDSLGVGEALPMSATDGHHIARSGTGPVNPGIYEDSNYVESLDRNTVNRSDEMAKMTENQLLYEASVELLRKKLGMLKYVAADGGGNR